MAIGMNIIDRRLNPKGKSLPNRQRLLRRLRTQIQKAVAQSVAGRRVAEIEADTSVSVPVEGASEPSFRKGRGGLRESVWPGNLKLVKGDHIDKRDGGEGRGSKASESGDGEDDFTFTLDRDEFLDFFFEDLALPDMVKRRLKQTSLAVMARAGFSVAGSPQSLDVRRTMRNSLARRLALRRPSDAEMKALEEARREKEAEGDAEGAAAIAEEIVRYSVRRRAVPWVDSFDVRYRRFEPRPVPIAQAVMFCLMDVSGSMTEHRKDLAKRFFMLLHLFLQRCYASVEIVFIRHTHEAKEVDEDSFFTSRESGGTVVSSVLDVAARIIEDRFSPDNWNIYIAQASDGDNFSYDRERVVTMMRSYLLPVSQYFAYLEVGDAPGEDNGDQSSGSELWRTYEELKEPNVPLAMRRASQASEIFAVFHDLFARADAGERS